jgi:WD40 repeat protein
VSLSNHSFARGGRYCSATAAGGGDSISPIDVFGPLIVTETSVATFYIDAVAEFDARTGRLTRLLAPRRADSIWFAARGGRAVTPRCDGGLVVHRDGCQVAELVGHQVLDRVAPADSIRGLVFVSDDQLVSLGADATIRRWDVTRGTLVASVRFDGDRTGARLDLDHRSGRLVVSMPTGVSLVDPETLDTVERVGPFSVTTGWVPCGVDAYVGISTTEGRRGLVRRTSSSPVEEFIDTHDAPTSIAVAADGTIATAVGPWLYRRPAQGQAGRTSLATPLYQVTSAAFSPDGSVLYMQDSRRGLRSIDAVSGLDLVEFERRV